MVEASFGRSRRREGRAENKCSGKHNFCRGQHFSDSWLSIFALRVGNKTMLCHPCAEDWITSPQIPSRLREARQIAAIIAKLPELPLAHANNKTALHSVTTYR
jgi:hypothetical protein